VHAASRAAGTTAGDHGTREGHRHHDDDTDDDTGDHHQHDTDEHDGTCADDDRSPRHDHDDAGDHHHDDAGDHDDHHARDLPAGGGRRGSEPDHRLDPVLRRRVALRQPARRVASARDRWLRLREQLPVRDGRRAEIHR
jgi:hypothetical protein